MEKEKWLLGPGNFYLENMAAVKNKWRDLIEQAFKSELMERQLISTKYTEDTPPVTRMLFQYL